LVEIKSEKNLFDRLFKRKENKLKIEAKKNKDIKISYKNVLKI